MATFVLVHGGFHGGWCWSRTAKYLRRAGHDVFTPTLTGLGERSHLLSPAINLSSHIQDVVGVLHWEQLSDVILCGHSYGGMVITGVAGAEPGKVRKLIYADAFVPEAGQSLLDLIGAERGEAMLTNVSSQGEGWRMVPPPASAYDIIRDEDRAWVDALLTSHPIATCIEPLPPPRRARLLAARCFVWGSRYRHTTFRGSYEHACNDPGWSAHVLPCGHDLMIDKPEELAAILMSEAA